MASKGVTGEDFGTKKDENEGKGTEIDKKQLASTSDLLSFGNTTRVQVYRFLGILCALISGIVYPAMAFYWAKALEDLGAPSTEDDYMAGIREVAYIFMVLGAISLVSLTGQGSFLEIAADEATLDLKTKWFDALLRQDMAYYDIKAVSGQATIISANANKFKKGLGRKLGQGIQFAVTCVGGFVYAFYASWDTSLIILAVLPLMAASGYFLQVVTSTSTSRSNKTYADAGSIVYTTISSIKTVLSLNACEIMIKKFKEGTEKAYKSNSRFIVWIGVGNGALMASFLASYIALTLYGSYLLYSDLRNNGCDPSGSVSSNTSCGVTGVDVLGALMGISFAAMGLPQISSAVEDFMGARGACYPAIEAINRRVDNDEKTITANADVENVSTNDGVHTKLNEIPLPKYVIDSSSTSGKQLSLDGAEIEFKSVSFSYPTRPDAMVFNGLSLTLEAGKTVALVGSSGCGKSTTIQLIERFYDPAAGSITLNGHDLRELNVHWLRDQIGLVGQEPTLFARTIKENIAYGCPEATQEQIEEAAKAANAHDFISNFPDGYDTHVGDKGAQLSGGQKQRICIARVLIKNPKVLLLDEATSALDSESEHIVQEALDNLLKLNNRTTLIIAHRLSTIRNADMIAVVKDGAIIETGTHDKLLATTGSEYGKLVEAQSRPMPSPSSSSANLPNVSNGVEYYEESSQAQVAFHDVNFSYPTRPDNKVFDGLNLSVRHGERLAIVGASGGGKSTIVQMIERFYDPTSGTIELNGIDLKNLNVKWLRDQIGLVSQEPTLFKGTIRENISYGSPGCSQEDIEHAAREANAHDFIMSFPDGYDTEVGETGTQVSGGQKQRIAIARAILKKPKILLLDEATSALDSESEKSVQEAIDKVMASKSQTVIVIAHRLSTIRNADRIAVLKDGKVHEIGTHDELMAKPDGQYKRLNDFQSYDLKKITSLKNEKKEESSKDKDEVKDDDLEESIASEEENESDKNHTKRAKFFAKDDYWLLFVGAIGAIFVGLIFPGWGVIFAYMIELLFRPILLCNDENPPPSPHLTCADYWDTEADDMKQFALDITYGWLVIMGFTGIGFTLAFYGFGTATERINKRVRDQVFTSIVRQDISFFDKHSVGNLSSQIEDDAAMIHSFIGEPIRAVVISISSVVIGLIISFIYMWPFALLTLATLPFMAFGAEMEMKMYMGDEGPIIKEDENSPGAIVVETLLNIRTVASLTLEKMRSKEYRDALIKQGFPSTFSYFIKGSATGLGLFIQFWGTGLMFWWGGYLLYTYPGSFSYRDYLISLFSLLFSISGISAATIGATDRKKAKKAAKRIFKLIDMESTIDPLSDAGQKGDASH